MPPYTFFAASLILFSASVLLHRFVHFGERKVFSGSFSILCAAVLVLLARHAYVVVLSYMLMLWFAGTAVALRWRIYNRDKGKGTAILSDTWERVREWRIMKLALLGMAVLAVLTFTRLYLVSPFTVASSSMFPTLPVGKRYLSEPVGDGDIRRGDIVLIKADIRLMPPDEAIHTSRFNDWFKGLHPSLPGRYETILAKRVIAVGGDKVHINRYGILSVNGQTEKHLREEKRSDGFLYATGSLYRQRIRLNGHPAADHVLGRDNRDCTTEPDGLTGKALTCTVPSGRLFLMGDNRDESLDSRYFGSLPAANLVARVKPD